MIKFFRRIRQKLLSENNFSKYLLYAIGEIVLVVIGILIALQINTYSEDQKKRKQEVSLLTNLTNEIELDILQIQNNTEQSNQRLVQLENVLQLLNKADSIDSSSFLEQSYQFIIDNYFRSNSGIFDEAVSSGKMSYIQNEHLRQNIFDYYRTAKESSTDGTTRQVTDELITPLFVEILFMNPQGLESLGININRDLTNLKSIDLEALKSNRDFWKMVLLKFGSNREQMLYWNFIMQKAEKLKIEIESELKDHNL